MAVHDGGLPVRIEPARQLRSHPSQQRKAQVVVVVRLALRVLVGRAGADVEVRRIDHIGGDAQAAQHPLAQQHALAPGRRQLGQDTGRLQVGHDGGKAR